MEDASPGVLNYIDGLAVHWYWDVLFPASLLDQAHSKYPNKILLGTEASPGDKPWNFRGPVLGSWIRAEDYIQNILEDLNHWVSGWIDWNLVLDEQGGPNYVNNFMDASIIANVTSKCDDH